MRILKILICLVMLSSFVNIDDVRAGQLEEISSEHFIVYAPSSEENFAKEILNAAEKDYKRIAVDLGYPRYSNFWTWDKRVKIYVYPDKKSFQKVTNQPSWSNGMADYTNKQIISYRWNSDFIESLLPHEIAHLVFRDFVGFTGEIPLWLDEGVAQWAEEAKREEMKRIVKQFYLEDNLLLLQDLVNMDIRILKKMDRVYIRRSRTTDNKDGVLFLSTDQLVTTYYLQAFSLIGFLVEIYGSLNFSNFCRELREGKTVEGALKFAYPGKIENIEQLEDRWREYLTKP